MKNKLGTLLVAAMLATTARANDFKFYSAKWNDLAPVMGITPFYGELDSESTATEVQIVMELYKKGKFIREIHSVSVGDKTSKLKLKFAIFFADGELQKNDQINLDWDSHGLCSGPFNAGDFSLKGGYSANALPFKNIDEKTPIFAIITNTSKYSSEETPDAIVKGNPDATILIGYLVIKEMGNPG